MYQQQQDFNILKSLYSLKKMKKNSPLPFCQIITFLHSMCLYEKQTFTKK